MSYIHIPSTHSPDGVLVASRAHLPCILCILTLQFRDGRQGLWPIGLHQFLSWFHCNSWDDICILFVANLRQLRKTTVGVDDKIHIS